ncbi:MAG: MFS transporter [Chloroflexi bacterium]|nr:MFS transporter [Chloroflexota bacterium]
MEETPTAVRRSFWPLRLTYLLFFAAIGAVVPFINLHFQRLGYQGHAIGLLNALPPAVTLFSATVWALVADRFHLHHYLLRVMFVGAAVSMLGLSAVQAFLWIAAFYLAFAFFQSPIPPLLDTAALEALGDHPERYGRLRVWGSIGFITGTWLLGWLIRRWHMPLLFFYAYATFTLLAAILSRYLPRVRPRPQPPLWKGIQHVAGSRAWRVFLSLLVMVGMVNTGMYAFLPLHVAALGGDERLIGFAWGLGAVTEIPTMWFSQYLLQRWGWGRMFRAVLALYAIRMILYGLMPAATWVIPINLLHGISFTLLWVSSVTFADQHAPPGMRATAQGVVNGTLFGLAAILGSLLGGVLYELLGPARMFLLYGGVLAVVFLVSLRFQEEAT